MKRRLWFWAVLALSAVAGAGLGVAGTAATAPDWHMNATIIEACSCPMFCQCYFNSEPAGHGGHDHFCRFNNVFRVDKGHYGGVKLDGAKFWVAGDLGAEFDDGQMDWAVLTFDRSLTQEQRDAIATILGRLYPVQWKSFAVAEGSIDTWTYDENAATALLDGGKTGEVRLRRPAQAANGNGPIVMRNLKYWGAPRNEGFVMMPNEIEAFRGGEKPFEYRGTNGFMITVDIASRD